MNLLKSALSGVASAVGTHYADEAMNQAPYDSKVYYGVAAGGVIGAFLLRNKSPIGAGLLFGLGAASAYQGYTRVTKPGRVYSTTPTTLTPKVNPYTQFVVPTDIYPTKSLPVAQARPVGPTVAGMTIDEWKKYAEQGMNVGKDIVDRLGLGEGPPPVPYADPGGITDEEFYGSY